MKCNNCGEANHAAGAVFCHKCGAKLAIRCANCGETNHMSGAVFCCKCGAKLCAANSAGKGTSTKHNGHEYVDLGLPSGLKWATCNVGASSSEYYGDYFAWGETGTKSTYTRDNSATCRKKTMNDISGNAKYDAARANWGGNWRMPTYSEFSELIINCTWTWTTQNGANGCKVKGPNGNSIFLPAAGYRIELSLFSAGSNGCYWSSTPYYGHDDVSAHYLTFSFLSGYYPRTQRHMCRAILRYPGKTVRPVVK